MAEHLERFRADGTLMGQSVCRKQAHAEGILHGASHIFICKKIDGVLKVLLQRRSTNKDSFPNCLDTSSAGHVSQGSDFMHTALQEMKEELGIDARPEELTELFMQRVYLVNEFHGKPFIDNEVNMVYLYVPQGEFRVHIQEEELSEVVWMDMDAVLNHVCAGNPEYCLEAAEFERVVKSIKAIMQ